MHGWRLIVGLGDRVARGWDIPGRGRRGGGRAGGRFLTRLRLAPAFASIRRGKSARQAVAALMGAAALMGSMAAVAGSSNQIEFNKQIRPILADNCYLCHGPDKGTRKAGLRLDNRDGALQGVKGRPAIVPGKSSASELVKRITSTDPEYRMPQKDSGRSLTPQQITQLKRWIDEGAKYEPHWAYAPPQKKPPPAVNNTTWVRNPIDAFILGELEKEGLEQSPPADRRTLIRRLSLDLLGLPPTAEEVDAFVADKSPRAYDNLVDRLLASPHFGERMAVYWLDLVRFADTVGYHGDQNSDVWPYRDYVIRAFNENMPFDEFTREQLAGDLFPNASIQQRVASAYNRLNMVTREGGAQAKEYLAKYAGDRVRTTSSVWMGTTLGCTQCHDHKFDPFTSRDFYSFAAFFADVKEQGVYESSAFYSAFPPVIPVPKDKAEEKKLAELASAESQAAKAEKAARELSATLHSGLSKGAGTASSPNAQHKSEKGGDEPAPPPSAARVPGEREVAQALGLTEADLVKGLSEWETATRPLAESAQEREMALIVDDDVDGGTKEGEWRLVESAGGKPTHSGKRAREQASDGLVQHFANGFTKPHTVKKGERVYAYVFLDPEKLPQTIMLQCFSSGGGWDHRAYWGKDLIPFGTIGKDQANHRHFGDLPAAGKWVRLEVDLEKIGLAAGKEIQGLAFTQHGGRTWWDEGGVVSKNPLSEALIAVFKKETSEWTEDDRKVLLAEFFDARGMKKAEDKHAAARRAKEEFEKKLPVCVTTEAVEPRVSRILPRGNWMDESGPIVQPAVPESLRSAGETERQSGGQSERQSERQSGGQSGGQSERLDKLLTRTNGARLTRLDLANWLVSRDNPLTARVMVNRFWRLYFGTGLSKVLDDLGTRGEWPRYGELLDWLAVEFMDSHWDVKHMVRLLVTSSAYMQDSRPSAKLKELDPYNRLYARQSRWRLEAEFVRDNALEISGLLSSKLGGPSARPYQPSDYYKELNFPKRTYTPDKGEDQYRRGLYTHWQRTFLHPSLAAFDAPSREECTAERNISNSPLQALDLLNDPTYVEAARVFGQHIIEQGGGTFEERLRWAFRRALGREPRKGEQTTEKRFFEEQLAQFKNDPSSAKQLIQTGYAPVPQNLDTIELAAWMSVARTILNLHETITRY